MEERKEYGDVRLLKIQAGTPYDWDIGNATHVQIRLPSIEKNQSEMRSRGYIWVDRTLDASIIPARTKLDYGRLVRITPELTSGYRDEILSIACESFTTDRRFHIAESYDPRLAERILREWINDLSEYYICKCKGEPAGFLALRKADTSTQDIRLAAVAPQYRLAGVAVSLYAFAVQQAALKGFKTITGCISSGNTAVMNLYALLGAVFSNPTDVYVKGSANHGVYT